MSFAITPQHDMQLKITDTNGNSDYMPLLTTSFNELFQENRRSIFVVEYVKTISIVVHVHGNQDIVVIVDTSCNTVFHVKQFIEKKLNIAVEKQVLTRNNSQDLQTNKTCALGNDECLENNSYLYLYWHTLSTEESIAYMNKKITTENSNLRSKINHIRKELRANEVAMQCLQNKCVHPKEFMSIERHSGPYGGKTNTCSLCGWENYTD